MVVSVLVFVSGAAASEARANPRPLPYTYIYETLPRGETEIEQYADLVPQRIATAAQGTTAWALASQLQTEIEFGLTDRLELGLYFTFVPSSPAFVSDAAVAAMPEGNGVKQRLRYRFADPGQWPIDLAVYGEVVENDHEIELEAKVILQRRVGPFRLAANAWAEREYYYAGRREWVLNPTAGAVLEKWVMVQPGVEYWMRAEYPDGGGARVFNLGPNHYAGPTVLLQFGRVWWSVGAYVRLNQIDRTTQLGDTFGPFWARTVVGIGF